MNQTERERDFNYIAECVGENTIFTDNSTPNNIIGWLWDMDGNGNYQSGSNNLSQNPVFLYDSCGTYTVQLVIIDANQCTDLITLPVDVNCLPIALFEADTVLVGTPTTFQDLSNIVPPLGGVINAWLWNFDDPTSSNNISNQQNPIHTFSICDTFMVSLTVTDINGCDSTFIDTVVNFCEPNAHFIADTVCLGNSTTFSDLSSSPGTIINWNWNFGDGSGTSTDQNPTYTYNNPGTYNVTLTITDDNGGTDTWDITYCVRPNPDAIFTVDTVCVGFNTQFTDSSTITTPLGGTITTWQWNFGDGIGTSTDQNPSYGYQNFGTFNVQLIITDQYGCMDSVTNPVDVNPGPIAAFTHDTICEGTPTTFQDLTTTVPPLGGALDNWLWEFGDGNTSTNQNPTHQYANAGIYIVNLTVTDINGCQGYYSDTIVVDTLPIANFNATEVCHTFPTVFTDQSTNTSGTVNQWNWNFGDGSGTSTDQNPTYTYINHGSYNVTPTVTDDNGCTHTWDSTIVVRPNPDAIFTVDTVCVGFNTQFTDSSTITTHWEVL